MGSKKGGKGTGQRVGATTPAAEQAPPTEQAAAAPVVVAPARWSIGEVTFVSLPELMEISGMSKGRIAGVAEKNADKCYSIDRKHVRFYTSAIIDLLAAAKATGGSRSKGIRKNGDGQHQFGVWLTVAEAERLTALFEREVVSVDYTVHRAKLAADKVTAAAVAAATAAAEAKAAELLAAEEAAKTTKSE